MLNTDEIRNTMSMVYIIGAAKRDAILAGKGNELQVEMLPRIKEFRKTGEARLLVEGVRNVLGQEWIPTGEFADALVKLHGSEAAEEG